MARVTSSPSSPKQKDPKFTISSRHRAFVQDHVINPTDRQIISTQTNPSPLNSPKENATEVGKPQKFIETRDFAFSRRTQSVTPKV